MSYIKIAQSNYNTINDSIKGQLLEALETIANILLGPWMCSAFPEEKTVMFSPRRLFFLDENSYIYY